MNGFKGVLAKGYQKGFTLVEMIIVITVLGLVSSYAVLSLARSDSAQNYNEITKISAILQNARRWAILKQSPHRLEILEDKIELYLLDSEGWQLEKEVNYELITESVFTPATDSFSNTSDNNLLFLPDGSHPLFELQLKIGDTSYRINAVGIGQFEIVLESEDQ